MSTIAKEAVKPSNGIAKKINVERKVFVTSDYKIFKRVTGNRLLSISHVAKLKESMKQHDLMIPIIVNENFEVIDGQHRLQARTEITFPVYYIIINGLGIHDTQKANANNKNWTSSDFLNFYCEQNYHFYKAFKEFQDRFQFSIQVCMVLLGGHSIRIPDFNQGEFTIINKDRAVSTAEKIYELERFYKQFKRRSFIYAINRALQHTGFSFEEFINKVSYQSSKLVDCTNAEQYLKIIEDIYNFKRKPEEKIRF